MSRIQSTISSWNCSWPMQKRKLLGMVWMNKVEGGRWYVCCNGFICVFLLTSGLDCVRSQRDSMIVCGGILNLGSKRVPKLSSAA